MVIWRATIAVNSTAKKAYDETNDPQATAKAVAQVLRKASHELQVEPNRGTGIPYIADRATDGQTDIHAVLGHYAKRFDRVRTVDGYEKLINELADYADAQRIWLDA